MQKMPAARTMAGVRMSIRVNALFLEESAELATRSEGYFGAEENADDKDDAIYDAG